MSLGAIFIDMTIQDIDDQILLWQTKLNIASTAIQKADAQNRINVLRFKREIETIRAKIKQLESR